MNKNNRIIRKFYSITERIINMKISDFMKKYSKVLPKHIVIGENANLSDIISYFEKDIAYILVTDHNKRIKGSISYMDFLNILGRPSSTALSAPFASVSRSLRRSRSSLENLAHMHVSDILFSTPPCINGNNLVKEALEYMYRSGSHYIIVIDRNNEIHGVITLHSIFRAIIKELKTKQ